MAKIVIVFLIVCWSICLPELSKAQEASNRIYKIGKTLFELQQQFLEHQEVFDKKNKEWKAQREEFQLLVGKLTKENQSLKDQLTDLKKQLEVFEEKLETSETAKLSRELQDVNAVLRSLILTTLYEEPEAEELILKLVNNAVSSLPRDLLILYLANHNQQKGNLEQSLGYYGTLVSQFPESQYIPRSIFEMSEIFERFGKENEQKTLLLQLSFIQKPNPYVIKAKEKLRTLQTLKAETTGSLNSTPNATTDSTAEATADSFKDKNVSEIEQPPPSSSLDQASDANSDGLQKTIVIDAAQNEQQVPSQPLQPAESTSDSISKSVQQKKEENIVD